MSKDLGEELDNIEQGVEDLKNKEFKLLGLKMTPMTIGALFAGLSTIIGTLYGGFLMYQKVEEIAGLDLDAIEAQMAKTSEDVARIREDTLIIKDDLKGDIQIVKDMQYKLETRVDTKLGSVDSKLTNYDNKLDKFELKVEKTIEDVEETIQKALDNPLAN